MMEQRPIYTELLTDLMSLEAALRQMQLWQEKPPSGEALASEQPFAVDSMDFNQWLQWLFIPRMTVLVESGATLPMDSDIASMAEYWCQMQGIKDVTLVDALKTIDHRLKAHSQKQQHQQ